MDVKKAPSRLRVKGWFLTYPQCSGTKEEALASFKVFPNYTCCVICVENHKEEGRHLHVFLKLSSRVEFKSNLFDLTLGGVNYHGNYQPAKSYRAVLKYIQKDGDFISDGMDANADFSRKYSALEILKSDPNQLIKENAIPWWRYKTLIESQYLFNISDKQVYDHDSVRGIWIWGPPGLGKSHLAREIASKYTGVFIKPQNKWFDGYISQECILLDDFDSAILGHYLKIWLDKWGCTAEVKGSTCQLRHKVFIITSNYHPEEIWYGNRINDVMAEAVIRRCYRVIKFSGYGEYSET